MERPAPIGDVGGACRDLGNEEHRYLSVSRHQKAEFASPEEGWNHLAMI